mgnify:CR=1 FL=1
MLKQSISLLIAIVSICTFFTIIEWDVYYNIINKLECTVLITITIASLVVVLLDTAKD